MTIEEFLKEHPEYISGREFRKLVSTYWHPFAYRFLCDKIQIVINSAPSLRVVKNIERCSKELEVEIETLILEETELCLYIGYMK